MNSSCENYFRKKSGPTTLKPEYASIIRILSFDNPWEGVSSALKIDVCDTPISRAASALFLPAFFRSLLAKLAKSASE